MTWKEELGLVAVGDSMENLDANRIQDETSFLMTTNILCSTQILVSVRILEVIHMWPILDFWTVMEC